MNVFLFQMLAARPLSDLGVWLHPSVYQRLPILLPHVIREPRRRVAEATGWRVGGSKPERRTEG